MRKIFWDTDKTNEINKKRLKRSDFDRIPFDIFCNILEYNDSPRDFLSLILVVKNLTGYILKIRPSSLRNTKFVLHSMPTEIQEHVKFLCCNTATMSNDFKLSTFHSEVSQFFPNLWKIELEYFSFSGFSGKIKLPNLKHMKFSSKNSKKDCFVCFDWASSFPSIESLSVRNGTFKSSDFLETNLKSLVLDSSNFVEVIDEHYRNLEYFELISPKIQNTKKRIKICCVQKLRKVEFLNCSLSFAIIYCPLLRDVKFDFEKYRVQYSTDYTISLENLDSLEYLRVEGMSKGVISMKTTPKLKKLIICSNADSARFKLDFEDWKDWLNLETLSIRNTVINNSVMKDTKNLCQLKELRHLSFDKNCFEVVGDIVLLENIPELLSVDLLGELKCELSITNCKKLEKIEAKGEFVSFRKFEDLPKLEVLTVDSDELKFKSLINRLKKDDIYLKVLEVWVFGNGKIKINSEELKSVCNEFCVNTKEKIHHTRGLERGVENEYLEVDLRRLNEQAEYDLDFAYFGSDHFDFGNGNDYFENNDISDSNLY